MTRVASLHNDVHVPGLDGSNPLAFLAAVGTLRAVTLAMPHERVRMGWALSMGAWRPFLASSAGDLDPESLLEHLLRHLTTMHGHPALARWDNLGVPVLQFRQYLLDSIDTSSADDRVWPDYGAAFGCDAVPSRDSSKERVADDTAFRTMGGAGHQDFLGVMRHIIGTTRREHLQKALFEEWRYDDPVTRCTLRWDPVDDVRRALQWRDPSGDPSRKTRGTVLGANRLAIEALPLFPTAPVGNRLVTTGFLGTGRRGTFWNWPLWEHGISLDVCRSLLAHAGIQGDVDSAALRSCGIVAVFRSQRITEGKYRNFTPARPVL